MASGSERDPGNQPGSSPEMDQEASNVQEVESTNEDDTEEAEEINTEVIYLHN